MTEDPKFTKIATDLLLDVRDLVNWGIDTENTTPEKMKMAVAYRREAAQKLIEAGISQRKVAKMFGVDHSTISLDLKALKNSTEVLKNSTTHGPTKKASRAKIAAKAASKGIVVPSDKYRVVYADPPWSYGNTMPDSFGEQRDHYPVMELGNICAVPVKDWVEDDAVLFLWATSPILEESFQVIRSWGFQYKASFVWDKIRHNMGHYNSVRHEFLLICTRGSCQPDTKQLQIKLFDSVQSIERTEHSVKPVEFYDIIETLYTHGRRLEMYGRKRRDGWDVYGYVAELEAAE